MIPWFDGSIDVYACKDLIKQNLSISDMEFIAITETCACKNGKLSKTENELQMELL